MQLIYAWLGVAVLAGATLTAQTQDFGDGERKIEVARGKEVAVTGCLERNPGGGFMLTNDAGGMMYALVTGKDLTPRVGERVVVSGKATDKGDAKLKITSKGVRPGVESQIETKVQTELAGGLGLKYLGVDSIKTMSNACAPSAAGN